MITSASNNRLKLVRGLFERTKVRKQEQKFVLDGYRLVKDALEAEILPETVLYRADIEDASEIGELLAQLTALNVECLSVEPRIYNAISDAQTPQGILGVMNWVELSPREPLDFVLVLDQMGNPGNLGSALRTATAVGVSAVILAPDSVDSYNPKVIRGAMGAHLRLPILQWEWAQIAELSLRFVVADAGGTATIYDQDWTQPTGIIIGGEAHGPQSEAHAIAEEIISIPMQGGESLNATVAASVILYEAYRQRHFRV